MGRPRRSQKYVRRKPTLNLPERIAAREVRSLWPDADARAENDPETALCVSLLANTRADILRYAESAKRLQQAKEAARNAISWMYNTDADLPFDWVALRFARDPHRLRESMFLGLDDNLVRMCMGGKNWVCPVCGGKH
jgi:hypothetical protein